MASGTVSKRGWARGYTFIESELGERIFFHVSAIRDGLTPEDFTPGSKVEFEVADTDRGKSAQNVFCTLKAETIDKKFLKRNVDGSIKSWLGHKGYGFATTSEFESVFVHASEFAKGGAELGSQIRGDIVENHDGRPKMINCKVMGWAATGDTWHDWAFMPSGWEQALAQVAEQEHWDYRFTDSSTPLPVLRKYLRGTFLRVLETSRIVESELNSKKYAAFNTGLVTPLQQEIIATFECPNSENRYRFKSFLTEGGRELLTLFGADQPRIARYFDNPADVIFDESLPFFISVEHIDDRLARAPVELQDNREGFVRTINAQRETIQRRVARNYKTAIPQYYRSGGRGLGSLQLLVPLCLVKPNRVDLALAVEKINGVYRGNTVLTVDMAYSHARLITRPDTEWLRPESTDVEASVASVDDDS